MTLEQHGFELFRSTYTWIFFNKYTVTLPMSGFHIHRFSQSCITNLIHNPQFYSSLNPRRWNPRIWKADYRTWASYLPGTRNQSSMDTEKQLKKQNCHPASLMVHMAWCRLEIQLLFLLCLESLGQPFEWLASCLVKQELGFTILLSLFNVTFIFFF